MKVWITTEFKGFYPVGTSAVVVAESAESAATILNKELIDVGLPKSAEPRHFKRLPTNKPVAIILNDGDY